MAHYRRMRSSVQALLYELKAYGREKYQLSIDGLRETHDWFRNPGSYACRRAADRRNKQWA